MEENIQELMEETKKRHKKKKPLSRFEKYAKEANADEALKEYRCFELGGKEIYYKSHEDLQLLYYERMHTVALAQVHLRDETEDYKLEHWSQALGTAAREAEQVMAQINKEISDAEEAVKKLAVERTD